MHLKKYINSEHYPIIASWCALRGVYRPAIEEMPAIGFVAYEGDRPIACAFIRRVEGSFALLDTLVSNSDASSALRHRAIDSLVNHILRTAKRLNIPKLLAYSVDEGTLRRSEKHGFVRQPHAVIAVDLLSKGAY